MENFEIAPTFKSIRRRRPPLRRTSCPDRSSASGTCRTCRQRGTANWGPFDASADFAPDCTRPDTRCKFPRRCGCRESPSPPECCSSTESQRLHLASSCDLSTTEGCTDRSLRCSGSYRRLSQVNISLERFITANDSDRIQNFVR